MAITITPNDPKNGDLTLAAEDEDKDEGNRHSMPEIKTTKETSLAAI